MTTKRAKTKILVVEDELSYRELYDEILSEEYELSFAVNVADAKKLVNDFRPDIAIVDMRLQNVRDNTDGLEVTEYIHLISNKTVTILKSGFPLQSPEIQDRISRAGIFSVLDKSSDEQVKELLDTIKRAENERHQYKKKRTIFRIWDNTENEKKKYGN